MKVPELTFFVLSLYYEKTMPCGVKKLTSIRLEWNNYGCKYMTNEIAAQVMFSSETLFAEAIFSTQLYIDT